jgi:hypothetical protein
MGFILGISQYCLGRWCLLKYWNKVPFLNTVNSLKEFRGFPIIQSFSDILHFVAISLEYAISLDVYESVFCYLITDFLFYINICRTNWVYLVHHVLGVTMIVLALHHGINKDTINFTSFYFEVGLLPIATIDFMVAYGLLIPTSLYLIRPIVYFFSRVCIVYHNCDHHFFIFLLPLLFHNAYILYLQTRSLFKHLVYSESF